MCLRLIVRDFILKKVSNNQTYLKDYEFIVCYWLAGEFQCESLDNYSSSREKAYAQGGEATYFHPFTEKKLRCSDPGPGRICPGAKMPGYRCPGKTNARVPSCPGDICPGAYG